MTEKKDIFTSDADALVNPVNCVGVMGKGLAKEFKKRYPNMFDAYQEACKKKITRIGRVQVFTHHVLGEDLKYLINFPTKQHWKDKSELFFIRYGLLDLTLKLRSINASRKHFYPIKKIAIPALGCGEGGLDWADVKPLIIEHLEPLKIELDLYEPW